MKALSVPRPPHLRVYGQEPWQRRLCEVLRKAGGPGAPKRAGARLPAANLSLTTKILPLRYCMLRERGISCDRNKFAA